MEQSNQVAKDPPALVSPDDSAATIIAITRSIWLRRDEGASAGFKTLTMVTHTRPVAHRRYLKLLSLEL